MNPNCLERRDSTVAPQALHLMNNGTVHQLAESFARRVSREAGNDPAHRIDRVYWLALSRPPSAEEKAIGLLALRKLTDTWARHAVAGKSDRDDSALKALTTFCHAVVNSAGFLYVD